MKPYNEIPLKLARFPANYFLFPKKYTVPKGWEYRTEGMYCYRRNWDYDLNIYLRRPGDWLEVVNPAHTQRIRYILY